MEAVASIAELGADVSDVYAWVDAQTRDTTDRSKLESLLPELHVLSQELSATLQKQLESFPSFGNHVQLLAIKTRALDDSDDTANSFDTTSNPYLIQLHDAKKHMRQCIHALEESAAWTQHSRLVTQAVADASITSLASHLAAMNKSLRILNTMPGAAERESTMNQIAQQVEEMVVPKLQAALAHETTTTTAIEELRGMLAIFRCLDKTDVFTFIYSSTRPASMHRLWLSLLTAPPPLDLASFYMEAHRFLAREWQILQALFDSSQDGDSHEMASNVWLALLQATMQPCSLATHLSLDNLASFFGLTLNFGHLLLTKFAQWDATAAQAICQAVFGRYWTFFDSFSTEERHVLEPQVRAIVPNVVDVDFASHLEETISQVWTQVESRIEFATSFANGALLPGSIDAIAHVLAVLEADLVHLEGDLVQLVHQGQSMDWSTFQTALALVQSTGAVLLSSQTMQTRLTRRLLDRLDAWQSNGPDTFDLENCQIETKLPRVVIKLWWEKSPSKYRDVVKLYETLQQSPVFGSLFEKWTQTVQRLLYNSVLSPIHQSFLPLPTMETWIQGSSQDALPSFSMLPQDYITSVADILLSLLPQLEVFAESSDLTQAMAASKDMTPLYHDAWAKVALQMRLENSFKSSSGLEELSAPDNNFVDRWTMTIASGTMALWTCHILKIPRFSALGAQQLACDLGYFQNVLLALGVQFHPILQHIHHKMQRQDECSCTNLDSATRDQLDSSLSFI
ncbi:unnamed protein product [Aphanomyces euteiches]